METLLKKLVRGNEAAFEQVYRAYQVRVYAYALGFVKNEAAATEITQKVFIRLWEKRRKLSVGKPLDAQLFRITKNLIIDDLRKQARLRKLADNYAAFSRQHTEKPDDDLIYEEYQQQLHEFIAEMPPRRREIFTLNKLEGQSKEDIAHSLSLSPKTVDAHLQLAIKMLRKQLSKVLHLF